MLDWKTLTHDEFCVLLEEGLSERDRRIAEMRALSGAPALPGAPEEKRPVGRPRKEATVLVENGGAS